MKKASVLKYILLLFIVLCIIIVPNPAKAQDSLAVLENEQMTHMVESQLNRLIHELSLNESQAQAIYTILVERMETMKQDHVAKRLTKNRIKNINGNHLNKLNAILTEEQQGLFGQIKEDLRKQKEEAGPSEPAETLQDIILNIY